MLKATYYLDHPLILNCFWLMMVELSDVGMRLDNINKCKYVHDCWLQEEYVGQAAGSPMHHISPISVRWNIIQHTGYCCWCCWCSTIISEFFLHQSRQWQAVATHILHFLHQTITSSQHRPAQLKWEIINNNFSYTLTHSLLGSSWSRQLGWHYFCR